MCLPFAELLHNHSFLSDLSMPFLWTPSNDRLRFSLGRFREFQWSLYQKYFFLPLKGITLRVTFPKVPRYGIMAIFPCYFETLVKLFLPSLLVHVLPLSSRDVSMPPSMSWSWVVRYSRRSILLEFSLSSCCLVGWSSQSKTSRQRWWSNQRSYEVQLGSWRSC